MWFKFNNVSEKRGGRRYVELNTEVDVASMRFYTTRLHNIASHETLFLLISSGNLKVMIYKVLGYVVDLMTGFCEQVNPSVYA